MNSLKQLVFYVFLLLSLISIERANAQGTSNKGTDFWLGYGTHIAHGGNNPEPMVVYITSDVNTTATVAVAALAFSQTISVTANVVSTVTIPSGAHLGVEGKSSLGIHVTALKPIIVYSHIYASSVSGATLVLPTNTLGKDYFSINYKQISNSNNSASFFFVVAVEDSTQVEITPSQATLGGWVANTKYTISLNKGEIYHVLGAYTNGNGTLGFDLTGSKIKSVSTTGVCKKIAVFSGSSKISISCFNTTTAGSADNLFQQVYPTATWGKKFITVPLKDRNFDVFRIVKSDPAAVVTLNGNIIPTASFMNNLFYDFESQVVNNVSSDKAIQVVQYAVTQGRGINCTTISGDVGDPEMIYLNPLEQTLKRITMYSSPNFKILKHFINVVVKNEGVASFKVDGVSFSSSFSPFAGNTAYSYAQIPVAEGTHNLICDEGFNAIAYGFGSAESYGYAAGANLTSFGIDPVNTTSFESVQSGCVGVPYNLTLKLPYQAVDIYLDKGDGTGSQSIPINLLSQTTKDGETTYVYSLINGLIYNTENTYSYKVKAIKPTIDDCGTGDEFTYDFIINPLPKANFTAPTQNCLRNEVAFTYVVDPTGPTISNYLWNFNGEGTSTVKDPKFTFLTSGDKNIKLSVKSVDGCWSNVIEKHVINLQLPNPSFTTSSITCANSAISFNDLSTSVDGKIIDWTWDFGDQLSTTNTSKLQSPVHTYLTYAIYTVTLTVKTDLGCINTFTKTVTVYPTAVPNFTSTEACEATNPAIFTNSSAIATNVSLTYTWDFNDPTSGLNNTSTDVNPTHLYALAGTYNVKLNVKSGNECESEIVKVVTVNPKPLADFTAPNKSCFNDSIAFTYLVVSITGGEYLWDFNGEGTSNTKNPTYTFPTSGIKKIKFSLKSDKGCWSDIKEKSIEVFPLPIPKFSTSAIICESSGINFTDLSTTVGQTITKWDWNFDDPTSGSNTSTLQNPVHLFNTSKTYNVSLTVTTDLGCMKTISQQVIVNPIPVADYKTPDICLDDASALFTNTSSVSDASGLSYKWDFGDAGSATNSSTLKNPSHRYTRAANYNVKLIVTSVKGCITEITKLFTVNGSTPKSDFIIQNQTNLCSNQAVSFEDNSTVDFGEITKIDWYFDDATPALIFTDSSPAKRVESKRIYNHKYPIFYSPAQRVVNVKMVSYSGNSLTCQNTIIKSITLKAVPIADFTLPDGCLTSANAQFSSQSTFLGTSTGLTYLWDFGDSNDLTNNTSTVKNPVHKYSASGNYEVKLTIMAPNLCEATIIKTLKVRGAIAEPQIAVLNENDLCSNNIVNFSDASAIGFGEINKIEWYFDIDNHLNDLTYKIIDNSPALRSEADRIYSFTYPIFNSPLTKIVNVKMIAFSGTDCESEIIKSITLKAVPNVVFNILNSVCEEVLPYQLTQASETTGFVGTGFYSGVGVNSSGKFSPLSAGVGKHTLTYTFTGANGCIDFKTRDIEVFPMPITNAGLDQTILVGGSVTIIGTATGKSLIYKWTPNIGLDHDDILNPVASPKEDTKYTLMVTSSDGCINADEVFIKVLQYPEIPNTFTPNNDGVNDTWVIRYLESYPSSSIKIFNRFGQEVFKEDKYSGPWDGKGGGIDLPQGMYYYIVTANGGQLKYSGSVMIIR